MARPESYPVAHCAIRNQDGVFFPLGGEYPFAIMPNYLCRDDFSWDRIYGLIPDFETFEVEKVSDDIECLWQDGKDALLSFTFMRKRTGNTEHHQARIVGYSQIPAVTPDGKDILRLFVELDMEQMAIDSAWYTGSESAD